MDVKEENQAVCIDGNSMGRARTAEVENLSVAQQNVRRYSPIYKIREDNRGLAIIFSHEKYDNDPELKHQRECAPTEAKKCEDTFKALKFKVEPYPDLTKNEFKNKIKEISKKEELNNYDCLVVIFASHGNNKQGNQKENKECICAEKICLKDGEVSTSRLWQNFTGDKCPKMAGKPKMFFIQACRGESKEGGILMEPRTWKKDAVPESYVIPMHSDMLMMWSSYPGTPAFRHRTQGSIFLTKLCEVLLEKKDKDDLYSMLLTVTRKVAIADESIQDYKDYLQTPYMVSTLMRKVFFGNQEQNPCDEM